MPSKLDPRKWLSPREVSELLGVHVVSVRKLVMRGSIPSCKVPGIGRRIFWPGVEKQLFRLMKANKPKPVQEPATSPSQES